MIGKRSNVGVVVGVACFDFVAVIGILAAIAIPEYQDYTIRAQVVEGLNLAARVKGLVQKPTLRQRVGQLISQRKGWMQGNSAAHMSSRLMLATAPC